MKTRLVPLCVIWVVSPLLSCGAGDRAAPLVISAQQQGQTCATANSFASNLLAFLRKGGFQPMADVITHDLEPSGALSEALAAFLHLAKTLPPPSGLLEPLAQILEVENLEPAIQLGRNALYYVAGQAPAKSAHYEVTEIAGRMLAECHQDGMLSLTETLLQTHVPLGCSVGSDGCQLGTIALIAPLHDLLADPDLRTVLASIKIEEVPEESFVALVDQVATLLKSENFAFSQLRDLMERMVYPLIPTQALRAKVERLFAVLDQLTRPEVKMMSAIRSTFICLDSKDPKRAIHRMLYTLIVDPQFRLIELVAAVDSTKAIDPDEKMAKWAIEVIRVLKREPVTHKALLGFTARLLSEKNARQLIPMLISLKDAGLEDDLARLLDANTDDVCAP